MSRKARVERTRAGGTWTEARFWAFVRSLLRQGTLRWPPRNDVKKRARRKSQSENKRLKWEYQCHKCRRWYAEKNVEVDHVLECGSLKSFRDLPRFVERLFCEEDQLVVLCKGCHKGKTHGKDID